MIKKVLITIFCIFLIAPMTFQFVNVLPVVTLTGVENKKNNLNFNWKKLFDKKEHNKLERRLKRRNKLFPYLIRTENSLNYWVFRQLGLGLGLGLARGHNQQLFEKSYLTSLNRDLGVNPRKVKILGKRLELFQEKLREAGGKLLVLITPNKVSTYPEIVPNSLKIANPETRSSAYDLVKEELAVRGITNFDAHDYFFKAKPQEQLPTFSNGGTHLSEYATCLTTRTILLKFNQLNPSYNIPELHCELVKNKSLPHSSDLDIAQLANLWSVKEFQKPVERTRDYRSYDPPFTNKPKVLFIGTSFIWNILQVLDDNSYFKIRDFIYYFKTRHTKSGKIFHNFKCDEQVFEDYILSFDYVVLEANHAFANKLGHGLMRCLIEYKRSKLRGN